MQSIGLRPLAITAMLMLAFGGAWVSPRVVSAAEAEILRVAGREAALEGETDGVSVGAEGELRTAPDIERLIGLDEPFVYSASAIDTSWILGTGNEGKIFRVDGDGTAEEIGRLLAEEE